MVSDSMKLELWKVVNYPWMLGTELGLPLSRFSSPASSHLLCI